MTQAAEKIISRLDRRRKGTKTFLDISKEERLRDFRESEAGMFLRSTVPAEIRDLMKKVLLNGTDCPEAENLKRFFLLGEENGQPFSVINKMIDNDWKDPEPFKYATAKSQFRYSLYSYLTAAPHVLPLTGQPCPICGNKAAKSTWFLFSNKIQKCDQCGNFVTTAAGLRTILHHFAAAPAKSFLGQPLIVEQAQTDHANPPSIIESTDRKVSGFNLSALNRLIENSNRQTIRRVESRWWFSKRWLSSEQTQAVGFSV